ncbi:peptidase M16 [Erythrobacter longus]|uniref:Peptidase M16 n=1 Tax=Erythrobacter longus TaxID=1044 RepID=A0A074M7X8_ERYLO|nr:M16 family metallopeptidase [Erythrobacter longus]KEO90876.1 peptidase M16 [Erythrobacter longus]
MNFAARVFAAGLLLLLPVAPVFAQDTQGEVSETTTTKHLWPFEASDIPVDPGFVFGQLENGMRYILRENATPEGTALVRMRIGSGSLEETESERGLAHFLEHMAFNGSTNIPEGEMIPLLEREGLAFGADTNATTGFEAITYMLDLPRNDEELLGTAMMLMRETASELTIAPEAVERERGVILAERRDRRGFAQRAREDGFEFISPGARYTQRLPIGTLEVIENATAADLRGLYERTYTPSNTVMIIVGDFPVSVMEQAIRTRFADWAPAPAPPEPVSGPVDTARKGASDIFIDPALSESVTLTQLGPHIDEPDTLARRKASLLRGVAYGVIRRRLARLARSSTAPFRGASFSQGSIFKDARTNTLSIASEDGKWREGMLAAVQSIREAATYGFTKAEITEQLSNIRTTLENRAAGSDTRANSFYASAAINLVSDESVPTTPEFQLAFFNDLEDAITPGAVLAAFRDRYIPLGDPLIRFQGRTAPEGGEEALQSAFAQAIALPIAPPQEGSAKEFAYSDFGEPGTVIIDKRDERLGFRTITFANNVRLTLKQTDIREDRVAYRLLLDGGALMNTREDPLRTYLIGSLSAGGLGAHSRDELQTILAGRSVGFSASNTADTFSFTGATTPRDLALQMQLLTAALTDPGYREEGLQQFRRGIDNFFQTLDSTPFRALSNASGAILSDGDPRFSLQTRDEFFALNYTKLDEAIGDRLASGAIELSLVGDFDEEEAIARVASTLGALPPREPEFRLRKDARERAFTSNRTRHVLTHTCEPDQALLRMVWPTDDDADFTEELRMSLLARMVRIELTDRLREELGQAYSPNASSSMSKIYPGYGTFTLTASVDVTELEAARGAIAKLITDLREEPIDPDLIQRARQPLLEAYDNALKSLGGWLQLADRAQSESDRLERWFKGPDTLRAITADDLSEAARKYLSPESAVEFVVLPKGESDQGVLAVPSS